MARGEPAEGGGADGRCSGFATCLSGEWYPKPLADITVS